MEGKLLKDYRNYIIIALIIIFGIFALWIRLLPAALTASTDILNLVGSDDPLYYLRQVEQMTRNFPAYGWFDAMTLYPTGQTVAWGPLMAWILSGLCLIAGAMTRPEIISVALVVPPLMAAALVPIMFLIGRKIADWKTGLLASLFIAVVAGQFFFRSLYGYLDHHIAEVLFSTLFSLVYLATLAYVRQHPVDLKNMNSLKIPVLFSIAAGFTFILGLFTMPTMILFAFIVVVFTILQYIWDFYHKRGSDDILVINLVLFTFATVAFFIVGPQSPGLGFWNYSFAQPLSFILLMAGTIILYLLSRRLQGKQAFYYPLSLLVIGIAAILFLLIALPDLFALFISGLIDFFGQNPYALTIQEARSWTLGEAWTTFSFGFLLMFGGFAVLLYRIWKEGRPTHMYVFVWSAIILFATWQHIRYEYYLAANIALLSAFCLGALLTWAGKDAGDLFRSAKIPAHEEIKKEAGKQGEAGKQPTGKQGATKGKQVSGKKKQEQKVAKKPGMSGEHWTKVAILAIACIFGIVFVVSSVGYDYTIASGGVIQMNPDWRESLEWMGNHTPDTGVDYYKVFNQATFTYPNQSYGVMSWWDYGHMITFIAKRIPNANPFQAGVSGPNGSAAYFVATDENTADTILDNQGTRYVITDIEMDTGKFWAMATWFNSTLGATPYHPAFFVQDPANPNQYQQALLLVDNYYLTTVSRLHNFDGSLTEPTTAYYIEYMDANVSGQALPVITNGELMNASAAHTAADDYNAQAPAGKYAIVGNPAWASIYMPTTTIPALNHYRLVHESSRNVIGSGGPDIRYVKVFEYVPGARIKGNGIIELQVVTDTGRQFTWREASTNGEFIVPYSTSGSPYEVKAAGKYHISGSTQEFDVAEDAVRTGSVIN